VAGSTNTDERIAEESFVGTQTPTQVVRRYRLGPAPLVRDAIRDYRTGRLDRVLVGGFDLFSRRIQKASPRTGDIGTHPKPDLSSATRSN